MSKTNSEGIYETLESTGEMYVTDDEILPVRKSLVLVQTIV